MTYPTIMHIPAPSEQRLAINVKPAAEQALRGGHPWLFDAAIQKQSRDGRPGDLAVIFDRKRRFLAIGLYDPSSPIRVRVLHHGQPMPIDPAWFARKIDAAAALRSHLVSQGTTGYRLIHGENDGLPGLVVDRYADVLVLKLYTAAWFPHLRAVLPELLRVQPARCVILRMSRAVQSQPQWGYGLAESQVLHGALPEVPVTFTENGLRFGADVIHGHKTGFFFDHRDNRQRVGERAADCRVLDVFAYAGGFSLYAARGGATNVLSLDISAQALADAQANFARNSDDTNVAAAQHEVMAADAFDALSVLAAQERKFDLVVVDPPAFAKRRAEIDRALASYRRLTTLALDVLESDGQLVMASCSSRITADAFFNTVERAAAQAGRPLANQVQTSHAIDHPVGFPEGRYLKCLFATVP